MSSLEWRPIFRPNSGGLQKKKKRSSPKLRLIFWPKSLGSGWWGWMHPEIETDFLAEIVSVRLVGGMHPPIPPPLNPPLQGSAACFTENNVTYQFSCHCNSRYVGRIFLRLQNRIKQHVLKSTRSCFSSQKRLLSARWCKSFALTNIQSLATDSA